MSGEKCQFCGKPATVHMTQIINNKTTAMHMCAECAAKQGLFDQEGLPFAMLSHLGESLFSGIKQQTPINSLICSECGCTPMSFRETGRLGCANCYKDLKLLINGIIESSQKGIVHTGKRPRCESSLTNAKEEITASSSNVKSKVDAKTKRLSDLQEQLTIAVKEERYEDAAKLRDKINQLSTKNRKKRAKDE